MTQRERELPFTEPLNHAYIETGYDLAIVMPAALLIGWLLGRAAEWRRFMACLIVPGKEFTVRGGSPVFLRTPQPGPLTNGAALLGAGGVRLNKRGVVRLEHARLVCPLAIFDRKSSDQAQRR